LGKPDFEKALVQHEQYVDALKSCGLAVTELPAEEGFPDSCFVEDPAVLGEGWAVITNPGAPSRKGEAGLILPAIERFYSSSQIFRVTDPGTLEGGDVMRIDHTYYVGLSARTNAEGVAQFARFLEPLGCRVVAVPLEKVLHLKTGVNYLAEGHLLVSGEFEDSPLFAAFERHPVPQGEEYAANSLWVNGAVIVPSGFPKTTALIRSLGFPVKETDTSEFRKIDGGLSCLSLRF
jgi:dimethylargininase